MLQLLVQYLIRRNQMPFGKYVDSYGFVSFSYWKAKDAKERQRRTVLYAISGYAFECTETRKKSLTRESE